MLVQVPVSYFVPRGGGAAGGKPITNCRSTLGFGALSTPGLGVPWLNCLLAGCNLVMVWGLDKSASPDTPESIGPEKESAVESVLYLPVILRMLEPSCRD